MEIIFSPMRSSVHRLMMGMAPPTDPSNLRRQPFFFARSMRSLYFSARGPLLTVMTSFLCSRAQTMFFSPTPPVFTSVGLTSTRTS